MRIVDPSSGALLEDVPAADRAAVADAVVRARTAQAGWAGSGLEPIFPIWKTKPTSELARDMIDGGLQARLTCIDPRKLDRRFAGRAFDRSLLDELPAGVDPCGENGEFHSFAFAGPMFNQSIAVKPGEVVERDGFVFADFCLVPSALRL